MSANAPGHTVVIGGTSGIGLATARALLEHSGRVTVTGRDPERLAEARGQMGDRVRAVPVDATDRAALDALFAEITPVDHVVLAASGGAGAGPFAELSLDALRTGFEAKLFAHLNAAQAALPALREGGSLTFVTAVSAQSAHPGMAGLAAINGALEAMISTLAVELAPLRVNAVSPGVIDTPWWDFLDDEARQETFERYGEQTPAGRVGQPEEIAAAIVALITNAFITGVVLPCDGGLRLA